MSAEQRAATGFRKSSQGFEVLARPCQGIMPKPHRVDSLLQPPGQPQKGSGEMGCLLPEDVSANGQADPGHH